VERELANVRKKFTKYAATLTPYDRKKYVLKLLYIYMLGYNVDFGHTEALKLISASTYAEKQVGYMTTSVILNERNEFLRMTINSIRNDVISRNETSQCLGLACIANVGGREFADSLAGDVETILTTPTIRPVVRKKAALCLLRLFRKNKEILLAETFAEKLTDLLDAERDLGVLVGVLGLLLGIVQHDAAGYEMCVPKVIAIMERLTRNVDIPPEYLYYGIPSPWLQVKCMKILQYFPTPDDPELLDSQLKVMKTILTGTDMVKNFNKNNALHAILFEAINLVTSMDYAHELLNPCVELLGKFLTMKEPNIRYLALNTLTALAAMPDLRDSIKAYEEAVISSLHDADITIRKRALTLLFSMCDASNVHSVINELLNYFVTADFDIREELALKTAILAERYSVNDRMWFIQVALQLIEKAGDFINDDLWHRLVQIATNNPELHASTAQLMFVKLRDDGAANELVLRAISYCLGEFGYLLPIPPSQYVDMLLPLFHGTDDTTRGIMLTAYVKIALHRGCDQPAMAKIVQVFTETSTSMNTELQQRSLEYLALLRLGPSMRSILEPMPEYPDRASVLEKHVEVENVESDVAGAIRKLGLANGGAGAKVIEQPTAAGKWKAAARNVISGAAAQPAALPAAAAVDLLGDLLGTAASTSAAAAAAAALPAAKGVNLDDLLGIGSSAAALPAPQERLALPASNGAAPPPSARPVSAATTPSSATLDDLLGLGVAPAAPVARAATTSPASPAASDDIFGALSAVTSGPASATATVAPTQLTQPMSNSIQPTVNVAECAKRLLTADNGLLYEDANVQIGLKTQWQGSQGRLMFYIGNKSATTDLQALSMTIPETTGLRISLQPVPASVGPKRQIQLMLQVAITSAFVAPPNVQFAYQINNQRCAQSLALPIRVNKFLSPMPIASPQEFIAKWHQMAGASQHQKIMDVSASYANGGTESVANALNNMRLTVQKGLDPNPANLVAGSRFVGERCGETLVAARVESDANVRGRYRFTVASMDANTSAAVMDTLVTALS